MLQSIEIYNESNNNNSCSVALWSHSRQGHVCFMCMSQFLISGKLIREWLMNRKISVWNTYSAVFIMQYSINNIWSLFFCNMSKNTSRHFLTCDFSNEQNVNSQPMSNSWNGTIHRLTSITNKQSNRHKTNNLKTPYDILSKPNICKRTIKTDAVVLNTMRRWL